MNDEDVISRLNDLIETCKDGERGFRTCAEDVKAPHLKSAFTSRAGECARAAAELQAEVARLGGKADDSGSAAGALHRGWVNIKSALGGGDLALLEECERGEDAALKSYREAMKDPLPAAVESVVRTQYEGAKRNHDQIRSLRDAERAAH